METKYGEFLFGLGKAQFFVRTAPTTLEKEIFWGHIEDGVAYGPFKSVYAAMTHYTSFVIGRRTAQNVPPIPGVKEVLGQVIYVDFFNKKRIQGG